MNKIGLVFLIIGGLLITNHPGIALKITNYVYVLILAKTIYEIIIHKDR